MKHYKNMNRSEKAIEARLRKEMLSSKDKDEIIEALEDTIIQLKKEIEELKKGKPDIPDYLFKGYTLKNYTVDGL